MSRPLAALALLLASTAAQAQLVVQPPPLVVQPPPVVVPIPAEEPPLPNPPPPYACAAVSYGPPLNLRQWPNGPWLATYWQGTRVLINGDDNGKWVHVMVPNSGPGPWPTGWMYAPYLVPVPFQSC